MAAIINKTLYFVFLPENNLYLYLIIKGVVFPSLGFVRRPPARVFLFVVPSSAHTHYEKTSRLLCSTRCHLPTSSPAPPPPPELNAPSAPFIFPRPSPQSKSSGPLPSLPHARIGRRHARPCASPHVRPLMPAATDSCHRRRWKPPPSTSRSHRPSYPYCPARRLPAGSILLASDPDAVAMFDARAAGLPYPSAAFEASFEAQPDAASVATPLQGGGAQPWRLAVPNEPTKQPRHARRRLHNVTPLPPSILLLRRNGPRAVRRCTASRMVVGSKGTTAAAGSKGDDALLLRSSHLSGGGSGCVSSGGGCSG